LGEREEGGEENRGVGDEAVGGKKGGSAATASGGNGQVDPAGK
jgi:hypothetical protein